MTRLTAHRYYYKALVGFATVEKAILTAYGQRKLLGQDVRYEASSRLSRGPVSLVTGTL